MKPAVRAGELSREDLRAGFLAALEYDISPIVPRDEDEEGDA